MLLWPFESPRWNSRSAGELGLGLRPQGDLGRADSSVATSAPTPFSKEKIAVLPDDPRGSGIANGLVEPKLGAEQIPRPYARAEENARALYGRFGMASSRLWAVLVDPNRQSNRAGFKEECKGRDHGKDGNTARRGQRTITPDAGSSGAGPTGLRQASFSPTLPERPPNPALVVPAVVPSVHAGGGDLSGVDRGLGVMQAITRILFLVAAKTVWF